MIDLSKKYLDIFDKTKTINNKDSVSKIKIQDKIYRQYFDIYELIIYCYYRDRLEKYFPGFNIHYDYIERDFIPTDTKKRTSLEILNNFIKYFNVKLDKSDISNILKELKNHNDSLFIYDEEIIMVLLRINTNVDRDKLIEQIKDCNQKEKDYILHIYDSLHEMNKFNPEL